MADKNIGRLVAKLNRAIQEGVELFNYYKELSKEFQEQQKDLMNTKRFEKDLSNKLSSISKQRKDLLEKTRENTNNPNKSKAKKLFELGNEEKRLKDQKYRQDYEKITEIYLVNSEKKFLKEKKKITDKKKLILKEILDIGKEIRSKMDNIEEFKKFIDRIYKRRYEVLDGKTISFKTLLHHLESGEVTENVAAKVRKIDDLMSIRNIINRKKRMEIGIKQKEIEKLLKDYEKTNKLSKNSVEKEIKKLVKSLNTITNPKNKEKITTRIDKLSRSLKNEMTERQRKIKYEIATKMKQLEQLKASS